MNRTPASSAPSTNKGDLGAKDVTVRAPGDAGRPPEGSPGALGYPKAPGLLIFIKSRSTLVSTTKCRANVSPGRLDLAGSHTSTTRQGNGSPPRENLMSRQPSPAILHTRSLRVLN